MKKIVMILMMVLMMVGILFAYEPTYENALYCETNVLPEECASYSVVTSSLLEGVVYVAPRFSETTALGYIKGIYVNLDKFRNDYKTTLTKSMENDDIGLYGLADSFMKFAIKHIPFVTYENFLTLTYEEMISLYCDYAIQMYR